MPLDLKGITPKPIKEVPKPFTFKGTLEQLYAYAEPNLPDPETVCHFHALLRDYCNSEDPLYVVRQVTGTVRGEIRQTTTGNRFMPTDNSPAWWMHFLAFNDLLLTTEEFRLILPSIPAHFHTVSRSLKTHINRAGWYIAHIYPVKDGDTYYPAWGREELRRRFLRNVHPCNHFYVPGTKGPRLGEDPQVIAYFAARYQERYQAVWSDFLALIDAIPVGVEKFADVPIEIDSARPLKRAVPMANGGKPLVGVPEVVYESGSLAFRYDLIEPLAYGQSFRIITRHGTFQMTKGEFYKAFPNVIASKSYQGNGIYSYSTVPSKARGFLIE